MKSKFALVIGGIVVFAMAGIMIFSADTYKMTGTVLKITNGTMIVEPFKGENELSSSDKFVISMKHMNASPEPEVGDIIEVRYNGGIEETYPARLGGVVNISVVDSASDDKQ